MPKLGMGPIRRRQLIEAAIASIHEYGLADATVARIARKAGVSPGIVHHYFADKDALLFAAMRAILEELRSEALERLKRARTPRERLDAIVGACFAASQFSPDVMVAWLALYGSARKSSELSQILRLYHRRLNSNLVHELKPLAGAAAPGLAEGIAAMIDGLYLRYALAAEAVNPAHPLRLLEDYINAQLHAARPKRTRLS